MADWMFDRRGRAALIVDGGCFRSGRGTVVAWISGDNAYSLGGRHVGWFENGVLYDSQNRALGFLRDATGGEREEPPRAEGHRRVRAHPRAASSPTA